MRHEYERYEMTEKRMNANVDVSWSQLKYDFCNHIWKYPVIDRFSDFSVWIIMINSIVTMKLVKWQFQTVMLKFCTSPALFIVIISCWIFGNAIERRAADVISPLQRACIEDLRLGNSYRISSITYIYVLLTECIAKI